MQKLMALAFLLALAGCSFPGVYKINVQQGNILPKEDLAQLTPGMTRSQVHAILGSPAMLNPVDPDEEYYVYTLQRQGGDIHKQRVVLFFDGEQYLRHEADLLPETPAY
ncbi:outer membrane protein assembly factor BamE [Marinobacter sp. X15-166B]|uniref:outer membrane protein assembly factor BamE n=1 Tax=Marinobacter sp. X15-166B TaxID=1897620 RepID=UPI00085C58DB|nr:outer membrane protein assembly factor BamE [Marinobacter sp. X15-166B]OEY65626.1 cell envelope protein SmpA [Marinobacter sp. X15-166B]